MAAPEVIPAVIYAAKSSEDVRGSIPTQLADCRAAIERPAPEFSDEAASAYHGNRGQGLTDAKDTAIRLAAEHGSCELWVQHSDRLARGDGITADHLAEVWFALRRHSVRLRSVQDDHNLEDAIRVVLMGERNTEDSKRKALSTRDGLKRRAERGETMGPVPDGYVPTPVLDADGNPVMVGAKIRTVRIVDESRAPLIRRVFKLAAEGRTPGEIARIVNAEGWRTRKRDGTPSPKLRLRGEQPIQPRCVRDWLTCEAYQGEGGYPAIVNTETWAEAQQTLKTRRERRHGGPTPKQTWLLRDIAVCGRCGSKMYVYQPPRGVRRYVCAQGRLATGVCSLSVRADTLESVVLVRLDAYLGDIDAWVTERLSAHAGRLEQLEAAAAVAASTRTEATRKVTAAEAAYERALGTDLETVALGQVARLTGALDDATAALRDAQALAEEFSAEPDADAAVAWLRDVLDALKGKQSANADELAAALRKALAYVRVDINEPPYPDLQGIERPYTGNELAATVALRTDEAWVAYVGADESFVASVERNAASWLQLDASRSSKTEIGAVELPPLPLVDDKREATA